MACLSKTHRLKIIKMSRFQFSFWAWKIEFWRQIFIKTFVRKIIVAKWDFLEFFQTLCCKVKLFYLRFKSCLPYFTRSPKRVFFNCPSPLSLLLVLHRKSRSKFFWYQSWKNSVKATKRLLLHAFYRMLLINRVQIMLLQKWTRWQEGKNMVRPPLITLRFLKC